MTEISDVIAVLKDQYGRAIIPELAYPSTTHVGDILFVTGNKFSPRPNILRVLQSPWVIAFSGEVTDYISVATLYPVCPVCLDQECACPHIVPYGSCLRTRVANQDTPPTSACGPGSPPGLALGGRDANPTTD